MIVMSLSLSSKLYILALVFVLTQIQPVPAFGQKDELLPWAAVIRSDGLLLPVAKYEDGAWRRGPDSMINDIYTSCLTTIKIPG